MKPQNDDAVDKLAKILWDYNKIRQSLTKADAIIAMGSMDIRVADRAAQLWHDGLAPMVVVSGGFGRLTGTDLTETEASKFSTRLRDASVPEDNILVEDTSTNSAENLRFSIQLLRNRQLPHAKLIIVTKPYMERRAYATFKKLFPEINVQAASPEIDYEHYPTSEITKDLMINIMVGDTQRVQLYQGKGYTVEQAMPTEVVDAMNQLIKLGYDQQLAS